MHSPIRPDLTARLRDLRIDLVRGIANLFILVDHIPHNAVNLLTLRNFGFSGATDLFVFVGGYAAALLYGQMAEERGFVVSATRVLKRVWQLYAAYVVLFVIYVGVIGQVASQYAVPDIIGEYNVTGIVDHPVRVLAHGLMLQARPLNLDTLQLVIPLLALLPVILAGMQRWPKLTLPRPPSWAASRPMSRGRKSPSPQGRSTTAKRARVHRGRPDAADGRTAPPT